MDSKLMQLRSGDEVVIKILSQSFTVAKMKLFRDGEEMKRPDGGDAYTLPTNMEEGVSLIIKVIADFCGLSAEKMKSDENGVIRYKFVAL